MGRWSWVQKSLLRGLGECPETAFILAKIWLFRGLGWGFEGLKPHNRTPKRLASDRTFSASNKITRPAPTPRFCLRFEPLARWFGPMTGTSPRRSWLAALVLNRVQDRPFAKAPPGRSWHRCLRWLPRPGHPAEDRKGLPHIAVGERLHQRARRRVASRCGHRLEDLRAVPGRQMLRNVGGGIHQFNPRVRQLLGQGPHEVSRAAIASEITVPQSQGPPIGSLSQLGQWVVGQLRRSTLPTMTTWSQRPRRSC